MGCVSSKSFRRSSGRESRYSPLSHNASAASANQRFRHDAEYDSASASAFTSYEELNTETYKGSFLNIGNGTKHFKVIRLQTDSEDSFTFTSHLDVKHREACVGTNPRACEEERKCLLMHNGSEGCLHRCGVSKRHDVEVIDTWELMEGLEDSTKVSSSQRLRNCGKLSISDKQISFSKLQRSTDESMGEIGSPVWKKYYMPENDIVSMDFSFDQNMHTLPMGSPFSESPRRAHTPSTGSPFCESPRWPHTPPSGSPFSQSPRKAPSRGSLIDAEDAWSVSSSTIGLKFLLSPANSSFHPSPVAQKHGTHSASCSFDGNTRYSESACTSFDKNYGHCSAYVDEVASLYRSPDMGSPYRSPNMRRHSSKKPSSENVYGSESPLFDPSLMATFEQALKATTEGASYDEWRHFSTDGSTVLSSSSADTQASCNTVSDAESIPLWQNRGILSAKVLPSDEDVVEMKTRKDLGSFDLKCPPRGEGKVVLYFTSLRGIRKTHEDCCNLLLILRGLGAQVDERDVWMHSKFKDELMDVLSGSTAKGVPQVPQLFIKGRYIGGAEEVKQLHEEGILARLMDGLALGLIHNVCDGCGDARFLPCFTCNGSRKVLNDEDNEVFRCRECNENGLIMCPMCII